MRFWYLIVVVIVSSCSPLHAQNFPCSGNKGGVSHCEGETFVCNDGSVSASTKNCLTYHSHTVTGTIISNHSGTNRHTVPKDQRDTRKASTVRDFKQLNTCPSTGRKGGRCPGYVVDHIKALACGGPDSVENMQFQTIEEGKAKDKVELSCER